MSIYARLGTAAAGALMAACAWGAVGPPIRFDAPWKLTGPGLSASLAMGDFNGDGIPDLAINANVNNNRFPIEILLGQGNGKFQRASLIQAESAGGIVVG